MNKQLDFFTELLKAVNGSVPDVCHEPEIEITEQFKQIGVVPENVREFFNRAILFSERSAHDIARFDKHIESDNPFSSFEALINLGHCAVHRKLFNCLGQLAYFGCSSYVPACLNELADFAVFKGWIIGVPTEKSIRFSKPCLDSGHISVRFFDQFTRLMNGSVIFDGCIDLPPMQSCDIQVGQIGDERLKQICHLRNRLLKTWKRMDPYPSMEDELVAFSNSPVHEYARFKKSVSISRGTFALCDEIVKLSMIQFIDDEKLPLLQQRGDIHLAIRNGWQIVIDED